LAGTCLDDLIAISERHQYLCLERGIATTVAELIGGPHAVPSNDLSYPDMRSLVYHDYGTQKFSVKAHHILSAYNHRELDNA
jgi:hypothetical protein